MSLITSQPGSPSPGGDGRPAGRSGKPAPSATAEAGRRRAAARAVPARRRSQAATSGDGSGADLAAAADLADAAAGTGGRDAAVPPAGADPVPVVVQGHHVKVSQRFRDHVADKLAKVERLGDRIIGVDVRVSKDSGTRQVDCDRVEITVRSRGPVVRGEACAADQYAAFDTAWSRLEARLRKLKDKRKIHHGSRAPVSVSEATAPLAGTVVDHGFVAATPEEDRDRRSDGAGTAGSGGEQGIVAVQMEGDGPLVVREKFHEAGPMTIDQALLAMELVGHDFYLFRDTSDGRPSVVYRRRGYDYGVLRLVEDAGA